MELILFKMFVNLLVQHIPPYGGYFLCWPNCNSMPLGAAWAYYTKVLVLASTAS